MQKQRIVLSGTACTGKSSVAKELKALGHNIIDEPARTLIKLFRETDESKLPWNNRPAFQLEVEQQCYNDFMNNEHGYFDRSLVDEIGYRNHYNIEVGEALHKRAMECRYDKVFFFPPWREIYVKDEERVEDFELAEQISKSLYAGYITCGYDVIMVPKISIPERLEFILNN